MPEIGSNWPHFTSQSSVKWRGIFERKFEGRIKLGEVRALFGAVEATFFTGLTMLVARCKKEPPGMILVKLANSSGFDAPRGNIFARVRDEAIETRIALQYGRRISGEVIRFFGVNFRSEKWARRCGVQRQVIA